MNTNRKMETLFDLPEPNPKHPAKYRLNFISTFAKMLKDSRRVMLEHIRIPVPSMGLGTNAELRVPYESIVLFGKGSR